VSVPSATESAAIVAVSVAFPRLVSVAEPVKSPPRVITGEIPVIVGLVSVLLVSVSVVSVPTSCVVAFGSEIILSDVASVATIVVSNESSVDPSKVIAPPT